MSIIEEINQKIDWNIMNDNKEEFGEYLMNNNHTCIISLQLSDEINNVIISNVFYEYNISKLLEIKEKAIQYYINKRKSESGLFDSYDSKIFEKQLKDCLNIRIGNNIINFLYVLEIMKKLKLHTITIYKTKIENPIVCKFNYKSSKLYFCIASLINVDENLDKINWTTKDLNRYYRIKMIKKGGLL